MNTIDFETWCYTLIKTAVEREKLWGRDLYADSPEINMLELDGYVEWTANNLLDSLGLDKVFETKTNPMRWVTVYDADRMNAVKQDFFEGRNISYSKSTESKQSWDEL